jgi:threonine dehydrogenase-like Zn-dependent dehydrogenase
MKAVVVEDYDSIDNIRLKEVPLPEVLAGQMRVKKQAASVGFVDGLKVQGLYQTRDPLPFTPGSEFAGIVDEAAADVRGFAHGTPVIGMARRKFPSGIRKCSGVCCLSCLLGSRKGNSSRLSARYFIYIRGFPRRIQDHADPFGARKDGRQDQLETHDCELRRSKAGADATNERGS